MTRKSKKQIQNQAQAGYMQNNEPKTVCGEAGKQNRIKTHSQSGRSMVEMLGVLAIIAILSIGGIVGFRLAMNYYQANQIAHEMNIMRTDAQIKIAQGTEKLTLGDPYDSGTIRFNNYPTDFDFTDSFTDPENPEEDWKEGYYITVFKIPQGVCKPLATLLSGMDGITEFTINNNDYNTDTNFCNQDENRLSLSFTAENMTGNLPEGWCEDESDCDGGYCRNHICIECRESNDCGEFEVCDQQEGICTTDCTNWECNGGVCVDGVCKECKNTKDCDNDLACIDNQCLPCADETDCEEKHCLNGSCVECRTGADCSGGKGCLSDNTCGNCTENPQCESNNCQDGICENCSTSADCTESRACENGICYDSCTGHESGCESGTHCDTTDTQKCMPNCQSSAECNDLQVCNNKSGICEDDCTAEGAMACKNGYHCDTTTKKCKKNCTATDCLGTTPICDTTTHECRACTENDCTALGKHCDTSTDKATSGTCVECTANTHCRDNTPYCDSNNGNICKSCYDAFGEGKPYWNGTSCAPCPSGTKWNINKNMCTVGECQNNDDCNTNGRTGYYCYLEFGYSCESGNEFNSNKGFGAGQDGYKSVCKKAEDEVIKGGTSGYVLSGSQMDWWSAERFCLALHRKQASRQSINCVIDVSDGQMHDCSSSTMSKLVTDFKSKIKYAWLEDGPSNGCMAYAPQFITGKVFWWRRHTHNPEGGGYALCQQFNR